MKIFHLTTIDLSLKFLLLPQLRAAAERGAHVVGVSAAGPWVRGLEEDGVRHIALASSTRGFDPAADLRAAYELLWVLRREHPEILHTHNPKPGLYGRLVGRVAGVPILVNTVHGFYATRDDPLWKRVVVYALEAMASRLSDIELFQSAEDLDLALRLRITSRKKARYLGNGIDLARFDPDNCDDRVRTRVRQELGVDDETIVVGMVGRLVAEKGYEELFAASERLGDRYLVVCVGPTDVEKADALGVGALERAEEKGIRFLGMRTDMVELYSAMDIFVLPSHREGVPRAAMEASAMGLPIVATDVRGCREVVAHRVNGLLVPVGSSAALAAAIKHLGEAPSVRKRMGERGRERAKARFDERVVVKKVLSAYRDAARMRGIEWDLRAPLGTRVVRPALPADTAAMAALHRSAIHTGFLPRLGKRFLERLYDALLAWPESVTLVADDDAGVAGFVAGVEDVRRFYRWFAWRHGLQAGWRALPRLLVPSNLRRAWETLEYEGGGDDIVRAELLSMAVAPDSRGQGIASELGERFLREIESRGIEAVRVVVSEKNRVAVAAYHKMGFEDAGDLEVHSGELSKVLVWLA